MNCKCCNGYIPDEIKTGAIKYHAWNGVEQKNDPVKCEMCGNSEYYNIIHIDDMPTVYTEPDCDIPFGKTESYRSAYYSFDRWDSPIWFWQCRVCLDRHESHREAWENCKAENGRRCDECSDNLNYNYPSPFPLDAVADVIFDDVYGLFEMGERIQ
jgi:hypothetical protein